REIKIWLKLDHENIVPLWGVADGFGCLPALVSPWLADWIPSAGARKAFLQQKVCTVNSQIEAVHSRSITHGDLSGNNVLDVIDKDGKASLTDPGLSALVPERRSQALVPTNCEGPAPYMAPE
ncbi:uncharacterized protein F5147DRAFT_576677, partial [Suillus discolor]